MGNLFLLAAESGIEGVSPDHLAADIAVPLGVVIFCGSIFMLLWSNFGWRKGGLILGIGMFGFAAALGVFWWFGAPGTPVATGLQNFPGQAADAYQPKWYPFEPGSPRAEFFPAATDVDNLQTVEEFVGTTDPSDPMLAAIRGDLDGVSQLMIAQFFPRTDAGGPNIGASLRTELTELTNAIEISRSNPALDNYKETIALSDDPDTAQPRPPSFSRWDVVIAEGADGEPLLRVGEEQGQRVAAAVLTVEATFTNADGTTAGIVPLDIERTWSAFKDPGALWLPSAIWTLVSFLLFALCLALLDRIEQREKEEQVEAEEAMDVQMPIAQ